MACAVAWLDISKAGAEKNTQRMYRTTINYFKPLNEVPISEIRHSHLQQIVNEHLEHPKTCKNILGTFSQIIRSAARDRLITKDAVQDILEDISLPHYVKPQKRALTAVEKAALGNVKLDDKKMTFLLILYYCGLRRQEALALTPASFDWEKKTIRVREVLIFDGNNSEIKAYPKSDHGLRDVPMADALIEKIRSFVEEAGEGFLFHTRDSETMTETGYRRMWESIVTALNIAAGYDPFAKKNRGEKPITGLTAHIFRHNYCTELCYQVPALSTKMIAKLLGDDERMVLEVYSHIVYEKENVAETINKVFTSVVSQYFANRNIAGFLRAA
ncbi:MAG: tyrosine-type recombinase/integrase [Lachnospiraceae bacterium]|nr:tyrosine-type recombinase/integrase [Lachnospiraceae bacterium]